MQRPSANPFLPWQRQVVSLSAWSLLLSGVAWLPVHHLWGAGAAGLPHPLEPWLMRVHALAVVAGLFASGVVAAVHVPRGWRLGRQRASGVALCLLWVVLAASGYALSYLVPESWHAVVGWGHASLGALAFALGLLHARRRPAVPAAAGER
jgi:hypothetical protein